MRTGTFLRSPVEQGQTLNDAWPTAPPRAVRVPWLAAIGDSMCFIERGTFSAGVGIPMMRNSPL